jgi:hypothetical protein
MVPRFATLGRIPKGVWVLGGLGGDIHQQADAAEYPNAFGDTA